MENPELEKTPSDDKALQHQPTTAELSEPVRIDATPEELADALMKRRS